MQHILTEKKVLVIGLFLFLCGSLASQIITDDKNDQRKVITPEKSDAFFIGTTLTYTDRFLFENMDYFGANMDEKKWETGGFVSNFNIGIRSYLNNAPIFYSIGASFLRNRVNYYNLVGDSSHRYTKTFRYLSFPIHIGYSQGYEGFFASFGLSINHLFSSRTVVFIQQTGQFDLEETFTAKADYNNIHFFSHFNAGIKRRLNERYGFYVAADFYQQLNNTYKRRSPYIRREFGFGFSLGFHIYM